MKYLAVLFTLFIVVIIVLADRGSLPWFITMLYRFPYGDKAGHFILFGLLNFFATRAVLSPPRLRDRRLATLSVGLILAVLVAAEEWSQQYFSSRTFDLLDLTASYAGLVVGGWAALRLQNRKTSQRT